MNLRTCQYFLSICEAGTFHAAARKLYISPQSLSERITKLEKKLGVPLFHRDNPLTLTPAGESMKLAAQKTIEAMKQLEQDIAALKTEASQTVTVSIVDYGGIPPFFPLIVERFLQEAPNTLLKTQKIALRDLPENLSLVISGTELNNGFRHECLLSDELVICVADELLQKIYGADWERRKERLNAGDLSALEGCPLVHQQDERIDHWVSKSFSAAAYTPNYLPLHGTADMLGDLCRSGQAAMITFRGVAAHLHRGTPFYSLPHIPKNIPSCYVCYPPEGLTDAERTFLYVCRQVLRRLPEAAL